MPEDANATPTPEPSQPLLPPGHDGGLRAKVPKPVANVVDRVLDAADEVADELKRAIDRIK